MWFFKEVELKLQQADNSTRCHTPAERPRESATPRQPRARDAAEAG